MRRLGINSRDHLIDNCPEKNVNEAGNNAAEGQKDCIADGLQARGNVQLFHSQTARHAADDHFIIDAGASRSIA